MSVYNNPKIVSFRDLVIWQNGMEIARVVYKIVDDLPKKEMFALSDQLRRSAVSVPSNIAEGRNRGSRKEFVQFLHIAHGSLAELETQLILAHDLYDVDTDIVSGLIKDEQKMISGIIKKLKANSIKQKA